MALNIMVSGIWDRHAVKVNLFMLEVMFIMVIGIMVKLTVLEITLIKKVLNMLGHGRMISSMVGV
jgi:hypothetical protein